MTATASVPDSRPPANVEAERAILGAILLDNSVNTHLAGVEARDYYSPAHQRIYSAIQDLLSRGAVVDYLTLTERLSLSGDLRLVGGAAYLSALADSVPTVSNVMHYARIVREKAARRRLMAKMHTHLEELRTGGEMAEIAAAIAQSAELGLLNEPVYSDLSAAYERIAEYQSGARRGSVPTGLMSIDCYAPAPDELAVIAARPSVGKTALAVHLAEHMASAGDRVLFVSIEMAGEALHHRRLAARTGIPMRDLRRPGGMRQGDWDLVAATCEEMRQAPLHVLSGAFTAPELLATLRMERVKRDITVAVIDHLGLVTLPRKERRDLEIGQTTQDLARLSKDLGIAVYLLCQLNRQPESRESREPRLADLRDSGRIEEDADIVWLLHRESRYREQAGNEFYVIVGKNRNGPVGRAVIQFDETTGRFKE